MKRTVRYIAAAALGLVVGIDVAGAADGDNPAPTASKKQVAAAKPEPVPSPAPSPTPVAQLDFYQDVFPFLKKNCVSCHNKTTTKAGLNMETPKLMIEGGDTGASIIPGNSDESLLVEACLHLYDLEMPPKNNKSGAVDLSEAEVKILKTWIDQGAKDSIQEERKITWQAPAAGVHPIYALAMSRDGRYAACGRSNEIHLCDIGGRQFVSRVTDPAEKPVGAHRAMVHSLDFSPDGSRLASGSFREVKIWKKQQRAVATWKSEPALDLITSVLSPKGDRVISADKKGTLLIRSATDGKVLKKISGVEPKGEGIQLLSVSPDGSKVGVFSIADDWKLSVWDLESGKLLAMQTSPDSKLEKRVQDTKVRVAALIEGEASAKAAIAPVQKAKAQVTKVLADLKAKLAKVPADKPDPELQKQVAAAETALAQASKKETDALALEKSAVSAKLGGDKLLADAAAALAVSKKLAVRALAWNYNGESIATAGDDKFISMWKLPARGTTKFDAPVRLSGAAGAITLLKEGGTADHYVSAGTDNKARRWSISQAKILQEIPVGATCIDGTGGKLFVTGDVANAVRIWDLWTGKHVKQLTGSLEAKQQMMELDWEVNAQGLEEVFQKSVITKVGAQDKALDILLQKAKDAVVANNKKLPTTEKAIKPAQDAVVAAQKVVDEALATIKKAPDGKADSAMDKALKAAETKLITAKATERSALLAHKAVQSNITDAQEQEKRIVERKAKNAKVLAAAKVAAEAATEAKSKVASELAALKASVAKPSAKPLAVSFSRHDSKVAVIFEDGRLNVWSVATGQSIEQVKLPPTKAAMIVPRRDGSFAAISVEGNFVATSGDPEWTLEKILGGEEDPKLFADRVNSVRFSPDGKTLATGGGEVSRSGDVILFDVASGKVTANWPEKHSDSVTCLDFSPDGKLLASGAADKIARVTEISSGKQTHLYEGHTHYVTGVAFRADGRVLATAGADGVVNSWDMILGERQKKIEGWTKGVTSLQFIGATNKIVTSAGDNLVRVITDVGGQVRSISKLPEFMQAAASTSDGGTIIGGGEDGFLRVWNGNDGKEVTNFPPN